MDDPLLLEKTEARKDLCRETSDYSQATAPEVVGFHILVQVYTQKICGYAQMVPEVEMVGVFYQVVLVLRILVR